uniref:Uncharacterized protein n=1 Tax=Anguilla anguilla TaxID=7936 RepID=A0A0E9R160_ANGAN
MEWISSVKILSLSSLLPVQSA